GRACHTIQNGVVHRSDIRTRTAAGEPYRPSRSPGSGGFEQRELLSAVRPFGVPSSRARTVRCRRRRGSRDRTPASRPGAATSPRRARSAGPGYKPEAPARGTVSLAGTSGLYPGGTSGADRGGGRGNGAGGSQSFLQLLVEEGQHLVNAPQQ